MLVSFIIPHKGRDELLRQTLQSLAELDFDKAAFEVIVVTQDAQKSLEQAFPTLQLHIEQYSAKTISQLRNKGVSISRGDYLAFLDADVALSNNWLSVMLDELGSHPSRALVSAKQICAENAPPLEKIRTALSNGKVDCNVRFLPGRNLFLHKKIFKQVGGFPEHLVTCEDYYFTDKIHECGDLYYTSNAQYIHLGEDKDYQEMFHKEIWRGQSNLQSIRGRKIPLSEIPSFLVPFWVLGFFVFTLLALLLGHILFSAFFLLLCITPITLYSARLYKIAHGSVGFLPILKFYCYYFPARIIGTLGGLFTTLKVNPK